MEDVNRHFKNKKYNLSSMHTHITGSDKDRVVFIILKTFYAAYTCWKENERTIIGGQHVAVTPTTQTMIYQQNMYRVELTNFPHGLLMSTLISTFNQYPGLLSINPAPRKRGAVIAYKLKTSALAACNGVKVLRGIEGKDHTVIVKELIDPFDHNIKSSQGAGILATPEQPTQNVILPLMDLKINPTSENLADTPEEIIETFENLDCKFCLNYSQAVHMFQTTCKRKPRTARNVADKINFLVTYPVDACRFWVMLMDTDGKNYSKLKEIENKIAEDVKKIVAQDILPKIGQRGTALYSEDNAWYRCYVLSLSEETKKITVFFCDYGNTHFVSLDQFRNTYTEVWAIPPQAIPCQIHGYENKHPVGSKQYNDSLNNSVKLLATGPLVATVVKDASYCQPHIVELKDIKYMKNAGGDSTLESIFELNGCIVPISTKEQEGVVPSNSTLDIQVNAASPSKNVKKDSLFEYVEDDLVIGMIAEVHNVKQMYLHLGDISVLNNLESKLQMFYYEEHPQQAQVEKNKLLLVSKDGRIRRVLILELSKDRRKARVLHVDYGIIEWVDVNDVFSLNQPLKIIPWQARPAALAGIDCSKCMTQATQFLKMRIKAPITANIIRRSANEKVYVEIFEMSNGYSLNKALVEQGYAMLSDNTSTAADDDTASNSGSMKTASQHKAMPCTLQANALAVNISTPDRGISINMDATVQRAQSVSSENSWNSNPSKPSFFEESSPSQKFDRKPLVSVDSDVPKKEHIKRWMDNSEKAMNQNAKQSELVRGGSMSSSSSMGDKRPCTPPFPPPDIISSNSIPSIRICEGAYIEGNRVRIGQNIECCDYLHLTNNSVDQGEVKTLREKWMTEKRCLEEIKTKLDSLMHLSKEELDHFFKESKKKKLHLKIRIKEEEKLTNQLEQEHQNIVSEINTILAKI
ncbi:uncharacterized protein LOC130646030 isoform X2 [Hydractinia symbiolongicarpus]|uniref:uncharacterized protein LOC130646030 isoform X2 n=1 Tax=Hydractinia symbiolongicarpus TaxID=13093 RepID=UPI00254F5082|nr:uncharacterized protein LOC130646030 isoform X2 [Hydractinia symbiolongicarpus]